MQNRNNWDLVNNLAVKCSIKISANLQMISLRCTVPNWFLMVDVLTLMCDLLWKQGHEWLPTFYLFCLLKWMVTLNSNRPYRIKTIQPPCIQNHLSGQLRTSENLVCPGSLVNIMRTIHLLVQHIMYGNSIYEWNSLIQCAIRFATQKVCSR